MIRIITAAVLAFSALSAAAASAQDLPTTVVSYADLNLSSPAGVAALNSRVSAAAKQICGTADIRDLQMSAAVQSCRDTAIRSTASQIAMLSHPNREIALRVTGAEVAGR